MVDERESPSAGWREVYREMDADPNVEDATRRCPDCGRRCGTVLRDVYECDEHGVFRASATGSGDREETASDDRAETESADAEDRDEGDSPDADETYRAQRSAGTD